MRPDATTFTALALGVMIVAAPELTAQVSVSGRVLNGGSALGNAAVYLVPADRSPRLSSDPGVSIDQMHLSFTPSTLLVSPGTEVSFTNSDEVLHNVFGPGFGGMEPFDLGTYPRGESRSHVFEEEGLHVVLCHVHPEMAAYVIVAPTPYRTVSGPDGSFTIDGVPPGRYRAHAWHARHWRSEYSVEILVPEEGRTNLQIVLGRSATPIMDAPR